MLLVCVIPRWGQDNPGEDAIWPWKRCVGYSLTATYYGYLLVMNACRLCH